jgi:antitoxin HicB
VDLLQQLAEIKKRRRSIRPEEMHALLTEAGFERRYGRGDHWVYSHTRLTYPVTIDPGTRCCPPTSRKQSARWRRCSPPMSRTLEEYLRLPYTITIVHDRDDDGNEGYVASVEELPGCLSQGATIEEAAARIGDAMEGWLSIALEDGREIPEPRHPDSYSGRFLLRIPSSLHGELARQAEREGVSLNQYVATVLSGAVGWRRERELV